MRKKIKQLAYGDFDYKETELSFQTDRIELEVIEGKDVQGEFTFRSSNGKIRGIVYSTNSRMECLTPQFEGEEVLIRYQFHSEGLVEGDVRKGEFVLVCDRGEYNLSFVVSISKKYVTTAVGKIKNLDDFVRLAREDFLEGYQLFYSVNFPNLIKKDEIKERLLYEAIRKEAPSMQAVEAYLIGTGKKNAVSIILEQEEELFDDILVNEKKKLCLRKDDWGYVCGKVSSDADFIQLEKKQITTEDFLGSNCFYEYYIDVDKLHAGKNYGRIIFEFVGQTLFYTVCVVKQRETSKNHTKKCKAALTKLYMDYRLKKIVTGVWAKESIRLLDELLEAEGEQALYRLMKAQAFLVNRQRQEASWILEDYKRNVVQKDTPEWGYYLYLCTLMEREEAYVNRLAAQIEDLFLRQSDDPILFWILLFVREDYYKHPDRRLKAVAGFIEAGNDSPFFYLEAFYLYSQDPYLLTRLGDFEVKILNWARKQKVLTKDLARQILDLSAGEVVFNEKIYALLLACYELLDSEEAVTAICSYLIKGQKYGKAYLKWYVLGIEYEARITNLYEAYLLSADEETLTEVPKVVFMYFQYHNTLSYRQLALLYAYIIKKKEKQRDIYLKYRRKIEQFAMSQIEAGHIDENLAMIYREMLPLGILNQELAEKMADILFVHKLTTEKRFVRAVIVQKAFKVAEHVQIVDGEAYFTAYTNDYMVLLQDRMGHLYAGEGNCKDEALLEADSYFEMVKALAPKSVSCIVHGFGKQLESGVFSAKDEAAMAVIFDSQQIRQEWMAEVLPAFMKHYIGKELGSQVEKFLQNANYKLLSVENRRFMVEQLIENHFFEQAYELLQQYGCDFVGSTYLVTLCSYKITESHFTEDDFLLKLTEDTFHSGKFNDVILSYLCKFYNGTIRQMALVWDAARSFGMDTYDLEERIITQMLYTSDYMEQIADIYESYCQNGGKELVCKAYLTYFSHLYLVKDALVHKHVFDQSRQQISANREVNDIQKYALLKYYAGLEQLTEEEYAVADALLLECCCRGIGFSFFRKLDWRLQNKYQLYDKFYIQHHRNPGSYIKIHYKVNDEEYREEEMKEVYDGVYVKDILLFYGDEVAYYITETNHKMEQNAAVSGQFDNRDVYAGRVENCYTMMNDMLINVTLQERDTLKRDMLTYQTKKLRTEKVFTLL